WRRTARSAILGSGYAHGNLAFLAHERADYSAAKDHADEALRIFTKAGDQGGMAQALALRGQISSAVGDPITATSMFQRALEIFEATSDGEGIGTMHAALEEKGGP